MPLPRQLIKQLQRIVGRRQVDTDFAELLVYESDGLTLRTARPGCVVYPSSTEECARVVKACHGAGVPYVPRGAGTGLSGGAISDGGVIIQLSRMSKLLGIHPDDRYAIVQPGVVNNYLNLQARPHGLEFAPDPSSQAACTIGGNLAENAGGPHTLKYGVTSNHILGQTVVFADGEIATFGGPFPVRTGPDFSTFLTGTEGTIAISTEITVRLVPTAATATTMLAVYPSVSGATDSVSAILAAGVLPTAMELIDNLCIQAVEGHLKAGFPTDAAAVLLIELDGEEQLMKRDAEAVARACKANGATDFHTAQTEDERQSLWRGRKHAVGSLGKITPAFYTNDGVVPRSKLTAILQVSYKVAQGHGIRVAHVCHAGDGNIHPLILYDPDESQGPERAMACSEDILLACLEMGGSLTGEHGIGAEKRNLLPRMFTEDDLGHMLRLRDGLNREGLLNPGKIFPTGAKCGELRNQPVFPSGTWI
ncbi:MAG: FAD-binding protein [Fidelibacterota bacterium]|nr:MAG: FAD-binding protein [Candidatus Neomarinimicrobiota bacterium]